MLPGWSRQPMSSNGGNGSGMCAAASFGLEDVNAADLTLVVPHSPCWPCASIIGTVHLSVINSSLFGCICSRPSGATLSMPGPGLMPALHWPPDHRLDSWRSWVAVECVDSSHLCRNHEGSECQHQTCTWSLPTTSSQIQYTLEPKVVMHESVTEL